MEIKICKTNIFTVKSINVKKVLHLLQKITCRHTSLLYFEYRVFIMLIVMFIRKKKINFTIDDNNILPNLEKN